MAKSWKEITSEEELQQITVKLPDRMGMAPRVYVPLIWASLLTVGLFLVLLLPGIRSYGTVLKLESSPSGAEVLVDGTRRGSTPLETFVEAGTRTVEVRLPGFTPQVKEIHLGGRRLGSAIVPLRAHHSFLFAAADTAGLRAESVADFAAWALGPEPGPQFQHPPVARSGGRGMWASEHRPDRDGLERFAGNLLAHARPHQGADILGALLRAGNPGAVVTTGSIAEIAQIFIQLDNNYPGFHRLVEELTGTESAAFGSWYRNREDQLSTDLLAVSIQLDEGRSPMRRSRTIGGIPFVAVPAGRYALGYPLRNAETTGVIVEYPQEFWIQATETTRAEFARFISAIPEWERDRVRQEGFSDYLRDWPEDWSQRFGPTAREGQLPVRYVHREAALAFARWLGREEGLPEETLRLPSANEWEYAAFLNDSSESGPPREGPVPVNDSPLGALGARTMAGSLWEWTTDWYGRYGHLLPPDYGAAATVMGGSFANSVPGHTLRGAQDPRTTSPFLGFRLVLVPGELQ
ncbi:MAG: PEGA domain-containing protein [Spirochaetaceae bacterium]|nr:MAG: PEGA domain-containing protein [Spirochaetaceae bacterium]